MEIKGIKQGKTIKLRENLCIPDRSQVVIEIKKVEKENIDAKLQKMKEFLATTWDGSAEFSEIMAEIDEERHAYYGRSKKIFDE